MLTKLPINYLMISIFLGILMKQETEHIEQLYQLVEPIVNSTELMPDANLLKLMEGNFQSFKYRLMEISIN